MRRLVTLELPYWLPRFTLAYIRESRHCYFCVSAATAQAAATVAIATDATAIGVTPMLLLLLLLLL